MMISRWTRWAALAVAAGVLAACQGQPAEEPEARLPEKEHTWVRTETVKKTKEDFFAAEDKTMPEFKINEELKKRLAVAPNIDDKETPADADACQKRIEPMDTLRMAVQRRGGAWHAFERAPEVRPYSSQGVQIDSQTNKMVFAFKHLCDSAKGLSKTGLDAVLTRSLKSKSRDELRQELLKLGEADEDVDKWLAHQKYYEENAERNLSYTSIASLIAKGDALIKYYDEITKTEVDAANKEAFLADTATLLFVINDMLASEKYMALALKEDNAVPNEFLADM